MPLILGTELVAELRRDLPELPIVLISAFADDQLAAQAHERGLGFINLSTLPCWGSNERQPLRHVSPLKEKS
jgi:CheY-like chemotaxis protein